MMMMPLHSTSACIALLLCLIPTGCNVDQVVVVDSKPDLIIESVSYERLPIWQYEFEVTVHVKNIGDYPVTGQFYLSWTTTRRSFDSSQCDYHHPVNEPTGIIDVGGSIDPQFRVSLQDSMPNMLFYINTNDAFKKKIHGPIIYEKSYENNSYVADIQW